ncbi:MAG TPA: hypothetical protein VFH51_00660 [Myxococcota bacterium]|nr:hypothetical protein [Myxococcota bacterium]
MQRFRDISRWLLPAIVGVVTLWAVRTFYASSVDTQGDSFIGKVAVWYQRLALALVALAVIEGATRLFGRSKQLKGGVA